MLDGAKQITAMLSDLLDTVRTQLGGITPLQLDEVDIDAVCQSGVEQFRLLNPQREVRYQTSGELRGRWDAMRVQQLLTNLLRNAFQHGDAASATTVDAGVEGRCAVVSVHNNGKPIPSDRIVRIFEPLRRGGTDDGPDSFSMGLGLYIAATIAQAHQGELTVESTSEQGTTFMTRLPLIPAE